MQATTLILGLIIVFSLAGCAERPVERPADGNTGAKCSSNDGCVLPMSYAIRSMCPYSSECVDGRCEVVCSMYSHSRVQEEYKSYPIMCKNDEGCDCSGYSAKDMKRCACVDGVCMAIISE
jgi:hypothetical protein